MIERSFTNLGDIFEIVRTTDQLGPIDTKQFNEVVRNGPPNGEWKADINLNRATEWQGSGTFAFWLPENLDRNLVRKLFDDATKELSDAFFGHLRKTEKQYGRFFDISPDQLPVL